MSRSIPLFDLSYGEDEERAVLEVLRSKWISMGPMARELESRFTERLGVPHAVALTNCTSALHLALVATGVGPGDEVIVPSLTFVATVNAVRYVGATPVFADVVGSHDLTLDPKDVAALVTSRTRALIPMHYGGFACDMEALGRICDERGLFLIEDAAHAPASRFADRALGTFGTAGCFSFFSNKNVSCAEGGMLVTGEEDVASRVRLMRSHGMTSLSYERAKGHATRYDVVELGFNYRIDDVRAALALVQLDKLDADVLRRRQICRWYIERLSLIDGVVIPFVDHPHPSSHYIFPIVLTEGGAERRDAVRASLREKGVETSVHYPAVHHFSIYRDQARALPHTEHVTDHLITLPLFGAMTEADVEIVTSALGESVASE